MPKEKVFPKGIFLAPPNSTAPDFVKGRINIKVKELKSYLDTLTDPWLRLDIKESRKTKEGGGAIWFCEVDTWEPPKSPTADKDGLPF